MKNKKLFLISIITAALSAIILIISAIILIPLFLEKGNQNFAVMEYESFDKLAEVIIESDYASLKEADKIDINVDFEALIAQNPDTYAYIYIPGTKVNYPILQNASDDYYLTHGFNGQNSKEGQIYTNKDNNKDFKDKVTVLYGHNMRNGNMFGSLREYYDESFFKEHKQIYILMPDSTMEYEIIAARRHDDSYLYDEYASFKEEGLERFISMATNGIIPSDTDISHVSNAHVDMEDDFLVLSVCINNENNNRYLVIAKLI